MNGDSTREHGICIFWNTTFGRIRDDRGDLWFVHYTAIESAEPFRALTEGQRVTFERGRDRHDRPCAVCVVAEDTPAHVEAR
jgi:cold shock CspA family protein